MVQGISVNTQVVGRAAASNVCSVHCILYPPSRSRRTSCAIAMIPRVVNFPLAEGVQIIPWDSYGQIFHTGLFADRLDVLCRNDTWVDDPRSNCLASDWRFVATNMHQFGQARKVGTVNRGQFELPTGDTNLTPVTRSLQLSSRYVLSAQYDAPQGDAITTTPNLHDCILDFNSYQLLVQQNWV